MLKELEERFKTSHSPTLECNQNLPMSSSSHSSSDTPRVTHHQVDDDDKIALLMEEVMEAIANLEFFNSSVYVV